MHIPLMQRSLVCVNPNLLSVTSNPIYPDLTSISSSTERKSTGIWINVIYFLIFWNKKKKNPAIPANHFSLSPILNKIRIAKRLMRFPSFEQTVPYFSLSGEAINILPVITNGDYAEDINYHYFQLLHPARPCRLWGQLPVEEPPPAAVHSLAEPSDCVTLSFSISCLSSSHVSMNPRSPAYHQG